MNKLLVFAFLFLGSLCIKAQRDSLKPLSGNAVLMNQKQSNAHLAQKTSSVTLFLPFFDEFSYSTPYPNANKWDMSKSVFVNHTYPIAPPTIGAATFDGLTSFGYPYNPAATSGSYLSDTLLSMPIRLDFTDATLTVPLTPADSIYLSFYYQQKGRGDMPDHGDALNLLFFHPGDSLNFYSTPVWTKDGSNISLPPTDTGFHLVMIPITDTSYFKNGFRFAFVNFGTQCGAIDHWHIDQVYLNKGRSMVDTLFPDVSFVYDEKSLLKNYSQMPYWQFAGASDMDSTVSAVLRNNNNKRTGSIWSGQVNITTEYKILNNVGVQVAITPTVGTNNFYNYDSVGYCKDPALINPSLGGYAYNGTSFPDTTSFQLKFYVKGNSNDSVHENDTAYFRQKFQNYYAYDDGTAEAGYYVNAFGAEIVARYKINKADTLRAVDIFFDPVFGVNLIQNEQINIVVWSDHSGAPYDTIFVDHHLAYPYPVFSKNGYNVFTRYQLSKPVVMAANTVFYVGTQQTSNVEIGIGYDLNTDTHNNVFFNLNDGSPWQTSYYKGSLMLRPVFGDSANAVGVASFASERHNATIYPNPASDEVYVSSKDKINQITISDVLGNTLLEEQNPAQKLTVSSLPNGIYTMRIVNNKGEASVQKLIIAR